MLCGWSTILLGRSGMEGPLCVWDDPWLDHVLLATSYARLFELTENKLVTVSKMFVLGWGVGGGVWK